MPPYLDRADVAHLLNINLDTLDKLRKRGGFAPHALVGARPRWRREDVELWFNQQLTDAEDK